MLVLCLSVLSIVSIVRAQSCTFKDTRFNYADASGQCGSSCTNGDTPVPNVCSGGLFCCTKPHCKVAGNNGFCQEENTCSGTAYASSQGATGCQPYPSASIKCCVASGSPSTGSGAQLLFKEDEQMAYAKTLSSITESGVDKYDVKIFLQNDNNDNSLTATWRNWWHTGIDFKVDTLSAATTLQVSVSNNGQSYPVKPLYSLDAGQTWQRVSSFTGGGNAKFTVVIPSGTKGDAVRLAKFYPYPIKKMNAFLATLNPVPLSQSTGHNLVELTPGKSTQNRDIRHFRIGAGERRVWIHSGAHPGETTSFYSIEGFLKFIVSDAPEAVDLRKFATFDILPMVNPDGVWLGNSRTNSKSINIEPQYAPSLSPSVMADEAKYIKAQIESIQSSASAQDYPIELLLNLHSTHGYDYPLHFRHAVSAVNQAVHNRETRWIQTFKNANAIVNKGQILSSSLTGRAYVEAFMFDKYSKDSSRNVDIMAITFEGTFSLQSDVEYVQVGHDMGIAIHKFLFPSCGGENRCRATKQCGGNVATAASGQACPTEKIGHGGPLVCCKPLARTEPPTSAPAITDPNAPTTTVDPNVPTTTVDPNAPTTTVDPNAPTNTADPNAPTTTADPNAPPATGDPSSASTSRSSLVSQIFIAFVVVSSCLLF